METCREEMKQYCCDPSQYDPYLEQLGIDSPVVRSKSDESTATSRPN